MRTGYRYLDASVGESAAGELVILGGRTGTGRSSLALDIALFAAQGGQAVAYFSYESTDEQVELQVTSKVSSVPISAMLTDNATRRQWVRVIHSTSSPIRSRIEVIGSANLTVDGIEGRVREISSDRASRGESRVSLVVVDPLRLMGRVSVLSESERRRHLAEHVVRFKQMAREAGVAVLLVGHVHPRSYEAMSELPELSDLEPLEVAQDYADKILLIHRNISANGSDYEGEPEVAVAKRRKGATG